MEVQAEMVLRSGNIAYWSLSFTIRLVLCLTPASPVYSCQFSMLVISVVCDTTNRFGLTYMVDEARKKKPLGRIDTEEFDKRNVVVNCWARPCWWQVYSDQPASHAGLSVQFALRLPVPIGTCLCASAQLTRCQVSGVQKLIENIWHCESCTDLLEMCRAKHD